jgi:peptide/nickel transport system permease protein
VLFVLLALLAIVGPFIAQWEYDDPDFLALKQPPSAAHWLGTDVVGADMFSLSVRGLGRSLMIGLIASLGITIIAAFVGTAIAYFEGWREKVGVWIIDMLLVIPTFFLLAIMVKGASGTNGWLWLTGALTILGWVGYARVLRAIALSLREREYVAAARFMGVRSLTILRRHMIPNLGSILIIHTVLGVVYAVQAETGLSFLGFGITPPDTSLGVLIRAGSGTLLTAPWMFMVPAGLLLALCFSMTMIGDGLRDALDPSSASAGRA